MLLFKGVSGVKVKGFRGPTIEPAHVGLYERGRAREAHCCVGVEGLRVHGGFCSQPPRRSSWRIVL